MRNRQQQAAFGAGLDEYGGEPVPCEEHFVTRPSDEERTHYSQSDAAREKTKVRMHPGGQRIRIGDVCCLLCSNPYRRGRNSMAQRRSWPGNDAVKRRGHAHAGYRTRAAIAESRPGVPGVFPQIKPPLLAIWGKHDPFFIPPRSRGLPVRQPERDGPISGYGTLRTGDACRGDRFRHAAASRERARPERHGANGDSAEWVMEDRLPG